MQSTLSQTATRGPWLQTFTGRAFYPGDPRAGEMHIEDIAHALSLQCRYNGHSKVFYSVAQHAVLVSDLVELAEPDRPDLWFWGLHHDDAEAYTGDIITQVKSLVPGIREMCDAVDRAVAEKFGLSWPQPEVVHWADRKALATEKRDIMGPTQRWIPETWSAMPEPDDRKVTAWEPMAARGAYLVRHAHLQSLIGSGRA